MCPRNGPNWRRGGIPNEMPTGDEQLPSDKRNMIERDVSKRTQTDKRNNHECIEKERTVKQKNDEGSVSKHSENKHPDEVHPITISYRQQYIRSMTLSMLRTPDTHRCSCRPRCSDGQIWQHICCTRNNVSIEAVSAAAPTHQLESQVGKLDPTNKAQRSEIQ